MDIHPSMIHPTSQTSSLNTGKAAISNDNSSYCCSQVLLAFVKAELLMYFIAGVSGVDLNC